MEMSWRPEKLTVRPLLSLPISVGLLRWPTQGLASSWQNISLNWNSHQKYWPECCCCLCNSGQGTTFGNGIGVHTVWGPGLEIPQDGPLFLSIFYNGNGQAFWDTITQVLYNCHKIAHTPGQHMWLQKSGIAFAKAFNQSWATGPVELSKLSES